MKESEKTLKKLSSYKARLESADSIQERIQFLVDCVGNPNSFSKLVNISVSGLKRYLSGGEPTAAKILQIAESTGVNAGWILTGRGSILDVEGRGYISNERAIALLTGDDEILKALNHSVEEDVQSTSDRHTLIQSAFNSYSDCTKIFLTSSQLINSKEFDLTSFETILHELKGTFTEEFALIPGYRIQVSAGHGSLNPEQLEPTRHLAFRRKWLKFRGFKEKDLAIVWAKGDSMEPTIHNNDTLVVNMARKKPSDGHIYIFRNGEELFVKRYQSVLGAWRLISDNPLYDNQDIPKDEQHQFEVIGQVIHIAKDLGD
ncbi:S24 family peptidase [Vibrio atlanticus]|uniref:Helix-turn-helix transcriptional regulator n=1 Tax=Vibrio atlanticus TaxID=693153 RepID=A0ABV4KPJ8_9VIBR